jgi:exosortase
VVGGLLAVGLAWVYWPTLCLLAERWGSDPRYSHGYLVPVFSLFLLWWRRSLAGAGRPVWWGLPLLAVGLLARAAGTVFYINWLGAVSLLPCVAGCCLLLGGRPALRWAWPSIAFLAFMVPLPFRVEVALAHPLQRVATRASTFVLQTLGFMAFAEGNIIRMGSVRIGVAEACSGLSMLVGFFTLATGVALVVRRPLLDRVLLVLSAAPIALIANLVRVIVTAILYKTAGPELADLVFHDLAGWLMMPLALALLCAELRLLSRILVADTPDQPAPLNLALLGGGAPPKAPAGRPRRRGARGKGGARQEACTPPAPKG